MASKQPKRLSNSNEKVNESKNLKQISSISTSTSGSSNLTSQEDDYEKGKKKGINNNREELDADRKAVEDLDKWEY